jgi:alpha-glucosidase
MIGIEAGPEGFTLSAEGRRVLSHSRRSPCVEIGSSENLVRQSRGFFRFRRRRMRSTTLKSYTIVESAADLVEIDFEGKLRLTARWEEGRLRISFSHFDSSISHFRMKIAAWPDERIFGCGERFDRLNLKLSRVPLWVQDRGIGRGGSRVGFLPRARGKTAAGRSSTPFPVPVFVSTKDYWCAIEGSAYTVIEFRRAFTAIDSWAVPREIVMGFHGDALAAVADMTAALGRPPVPPYWAFEGAWLGVLGGFSAMERKLGAVLAAGAKISAIFVQDWCGPVAAGPSAAGPSAAGPSAAGPSAAGPSVRAARDWTWDRELYPDLPGKIAELRARGIRFIGYINPFLDPEGRLYAEASARGFCVKDAEGRDYMIAVPAATAASVVAMVDLTNGEAFAWMKSVIKRELIGIGMSGWMADSGEYLPADAVLASGEDAAQVHNYWPVLWARLNREAVEDADRLGDVLFFLRSGWFGSSRHATAFWAGEQREDFSKYGGLASLVPAAVSLGLSGGGFWHSDTGGSISSAWARRGSECLARWMEMSAFTPFFRGCEGTQPEVSAQFWSDPSSLSLFARMSEIYAALKPYHVAVAVEQAEGGLPPIRHPWMHYEGDSQAQRLSCQYLYGRDLMIAPVLSPRAALTELYLPEDEWVHLWSSRGFRGGYVAVESPQGYPAVFYRAASPFAPLFDALRRTAKRI